jgi:formiminoglutamase
MNSKSQLFQFIPFDSEDIKERYHQRKGELKLGDQNSSLKGAKYVILGIEESVGPRANKGKDGAQYGFEAFLSKFLNMQSNDSLSGKDTCVVGKIILTNSDVSFEKLSNAVEELDEFVYEVLSENVSDDQIPIVIGGGHNNAYPLMKYTFLKRQKKFDIINLDAHADYRALEGRHSGNPFSYAYNDGFIEKYTVFGLHQRYNSQQIIDDLTKDDQMFTFFEDYIDEKRGIKVDIKNYVKQKALSFTGIELDLDSIENMPSSAFSPSGISTETARYYIRNMSKLKKVAYLHLPEGAPMNDYEKSVVGKTLAYLVTDFISCHGALKV